MLFIVADEDDFANAGNFGNGFQAVPDDRVASNVEQWLQEASETEHRLPDSVSQTLGTSSDKGLKRVPLDGPPT